MTRFLSQTIGSHWVVETRKTGDLVELSRINTGWTKIPLKNKPISRHIFTYPTSVTKLKAFRALVKFPGLLL